MALNLDILSVCGSGVLLMKAQLYFVEVEGSESGHSSCLWIGCAAHESISMFCGSGVIGKTNKEELACSLAYDKCTTH